MGIAAWLDSIRLRLVVLAAAVMLPLAVLAAAMTWVGDRSASDRPMREVRQGLAVEVARHEAVVVAVRETLRALSLVPEGRGCGSRL